MGVNLPMPGHIDGFYPRAIGAGRNPSTTPAPSSIDASAVNGMYQGMTPWVSFGLDVGQTDIPRFIYDDFNRGDFGSQSGVPHGNQYRRGGLQVLSTGSSSPRIDNFIVQDIAADDDE